MELIYNQFQIWTDLEHRTWPNPNRNSFAITCGLRPHWTYNDSLQILSPWYNNLYLPAYQPTSLQRKKGAHPQHLQQEAVSRFRSRSAGWSSLTGHPTGNERQTNAQTTDGVQRSCIATQRLTTGRASRTHTDAHVLGEVRWRYAAQEAAESTAAIAVQGVTRRFTHRITRRCIHISTVTLVRTYHNYGLSCLILGGIG